MGASTLLDIIGSFIVFGMLLLSGLGMDLNAINDRFAYNTAVNLQLQLVSLTAQIENDFQKIGYDPTSTTLTNPSSSAVRYGNANDFRFAGDMNNDGSIDSVEYLLGPSQNLSNPDSLLHHLFHNLRHSAFGKHYPEHLQLHIIFMEKEIPGMGIIART